jgi:hypothetical protein
LEQKNSQKHLKGAKTEKKEGERARNTPVLVKTDSSNTPQDGIEAAAKDHYQQKEQWQKSAQKELHTFLHQIRGPKVTRSQQRSN